MDVTINLSKTGCTVAELTAAVAQAKRGGWRVTWHADEVVD